MAAPVLVTRRGPSGQRGAPCRRRVRRLGRRVREGLTDLRALLRKFPPALYPTTERVEDYDDPECTRVVCMSVQDGCLHRRAWNGAPARVGLRHDIIVDGPEMARALQTFVDTIVDTVEDVAEASEGHSVKGVLLKPGTQADAWANEDQRERRNQWWTVEKLRADRTGFDTAVKRATSSHHKVAMECTVRAPVPPARDAEMALRAAVRRRGKT